MEIRIVITKEKIKANGFAIFCWLNVLMGLYFTLESFKEFETRAAYLFLGWTAVFITASFIPWLWRKAKGRGRLATENRIRVTG